MVIIFVGRCLLQTEARSVHIHSLLRLHFNFELLTLLDVRRKALRSILCFVLIGLHHTHQYTSQRVVIDIRCERYASKPKPSQGCTGRAGAPSRIGLTRPIFTRYFCCGLGLLILNRERLALYSYNLSCRLSHLKPDAHVVEALANVCFLVRRPDSRSKHAFKIRENTRIDINPESIQNFFRRSRFKRISRKRSLAMPISDIP